ncbi:uncharacterized protein G2W53_017079 [Senna tora]|uniref:Uncharacterized protein n=1 Tax=Senna tora TaxID=362788 RepID=A0A834TPV1_9FABA|nr:uncharacterized protein G2W53_017079 [Senna tora]
MRKIPRKQSNLPRARKKRSRVQGVLLEIQHQENFSTKSVNKLETLEQTEIKSTKRIPKILKERREKTMK